MSGSSGEAVDPLVVFHHIPKTAGRSLQSVVRANYERRRLAQLYGAPSDREWCRLWWEALPEPERRDLACVLGHRTNLLFSVVDRPFHAFCLIRHPLERVQSLFWFFGSRHVRRRAKINVGARADRELPALLASGEWGLDDIYVRLGNGGLESSSTHRTMSGFFDGQVRALLDGYPDLTVPSSFAPNAPSEDSTMSALLDRLARDYTIGLTDRFERSVERFAAAFGWREVFVPRRNVGTKRAVADELSPATRELILAHNQRDLALYERYAREMGSLEERAPRRPSRWFRSMRIQLAGRES